MNEQEKKALAEAFDGIIEDNRRHPPKARIVKCGMCQQFIPFSLTCMKYPKGIPGDILREKEACPMYKQK